MMSYTSSILYMYVMVLISMAYFTLLEQKTLGLMQIRKGPSKVGPEGTFQPFADAIKLFVKKNMSSMMSNNMTFYTTPLLKLMFALMLWMVIPNPELNLQLSCNVIMFLAISSCMVYMVVGMGWASNSKYALLGALRGFAQMISYEVTMGLVLISILIPMSSLDTYWMFKNTKFCMALLFPPLLYIWFTIMLAETNRAPFDFTEAESELVSGFNVEYSGTPFAFIFMAEYTSIMAVSFFTSTVMLQKSTSLLMSYLFMVIQSVLLMLIFIIIRGTMPRMRYDKLMSLTWKYFLAMSLIYIMLASMLITIFKSVYTTSY